MLWQKSNEMKMNSNRSINFLQKLNNPELSNPEKRIVILDFSFEVFPKLEKY